MLHEEYKTGFETNKNANRHFTIGKTSSSFNSILNRLEQITASVAYRCPEEEIAVWIQVNKSKGTYCAIYFGLRLEYGDFRRYGITFGKEVDVGDDNVGYRTTSEPGYTKIEDVKKELTLQFNWHDISVTNATFETIGRNGLILYKFNARSKR